MLLLNVLHILVNSVEKVSFLGDIAHVLTSVLVSRFIMNLRDAGARGSSTDSDAVSAGDTGALETWHAERGTADGGTLVFASNFVESLGGPLDRGGVDDSDPGMLSAQAEAPVESGGAKVTV
ncbi:hypothetical protein TRAPUB_9866 [Trametes pubescens]|uniref:Uncharacterized protein n=1 Tax=Trametes pubescens TaxID=154538 RepID=A0A1M2W141_TRAPU|nr:hypothetical protein TRAPUB_9866 [Trametes pubescens]